MDCDGAAVATPRSESPGYADRADAGKHGLEHQPVQGIARRHKLRQRFRRLCRKRCVPAAAPQSWCRADVGGRLAGGDAWRIDPEPDALRLSVLAIKVVGFAQHAGDQKARRIDGAAYSIGVVASFAALGLLVVVLRGVPARQQLSWGSSCRCLEWCQLWPCCSP